MDAKKREEAEAVVGGKLVEADGAIELPLLYAGAGQLDVHEQPLCVDDLMVACSSPSPVPSLCKWCGSRSLASALALVRAALPFRGGMLGSECGEGRGNRVVLGLAEHKREAPLVVHAPSMSVMRM